MAIEPPSDIVLDVLKAADPTRAAAASQRLSELGNMRGASSPDFATAVDEVAKTAGAIGNSSSAVAAGALNQPTTRLSNDAGSKNQTEFDAMLLSNFVKEILPKDASSVFGRGFAGEMWKSMLADQVSRQLASSGALPISKRLFATHPLASMKGEDVLADGSSRAPATTQMSANAISLPVGADLTNSAVLFANRSKS